MKKAGTILLVFILLFPGFILGFLASFAYKIVMARILDGGLLNFISDGYFSGFNRAFIPEIIRGLIAGSSSIYFASKIVKSQDFELAAYANSALFILISVYGAFIELSLGGLNLGLVEIVCNNFGVIIGLFIMSRKIVGELSENENISDRTHPQRVAKECENPRCASILNIPFGREGWVNCPSCGRRQYVSTKT